MMMAVYQRFGWTCCLHLYGEVTNLKGGGRFLWSDGK